MNLQNLGSLFSARHCVSLVALSLALACGGSKPPPAKTPVPEAKPGAGEPLEEKADLSPVPAPKELVLVGRLARPITLADTVTRWAGVPVSVRQLLPADMKWAEPVIAWDAPIQLAGTVEGKGTPQLSVVVSLGLTSVDAAVAGLRDQGHSLRRVGPGIYQIAGDEPSCFIAAARGQAPARLVCGEGARQVERLLPFATRGLPEMPAGKSDLEIEFAAEPLQRMYAQQLSSLTFLSGFAIRQLSIDHQGFDRALADAMYALAGELQVLAADLDRVRIEGKLDEAASTLELSASLKLRSDKSWIGQAMAEAAQKSGPPPEVFWQLPDASTQASYAGELNPERFKPIARTLGDLADGYLDKEKVGKRSRDRVRALISDLFGLSGVIVQAEGHVGGAQPKDPTLQQRFAQSLGWQLTVSDAAPESFLRVYRGLHAVLNDRDVRKLAAKRLDIEAKLLPTSVEKALTGKGVPGGGRAFVVTVPAGLLDKYKKELATPEGAKGKPSSLQLVLAVVPDGKRTLMVMAPDEKLAAERIAAFKAGKEPALAQRQDLASLRSLKAFAAGFASIAAMDEQLLSVAQRGGGDGQKVLDGVPHKGRTPIITKVTVDRGDGITLRLGVSVPKAAVEDMGAFVPMLAPKF